MNTANQNLPEGFAQTAANYLAATSELVDVIMALAPERYETAKSLLAEGRLIPQIQTMPGMMTVSLIDVRTGESIGDVFRYAAPALLAGGTLQ